jgi:hypothetical protein
MAQHSQTTPGATEYVGCPDQVKNPETQVWECWREVVVKVVMERAFGQPYSTVCRGKGCDHWHKYKRLGELLRAKEPEAQRTPA